MRTTMQPISALASPPSSGVVDTTSDCPALQVKAVPPLRAPALFSSRLAAVQTSIKGRPWTRLQNFPFSFLSIRLHTHTQTRSYIQLGLCLDKQTSLQPSLTIYSHSHLTLVLSHCHTYFSPPHTHHITHSSLSLSFDKHTLHNGSLFHTIVLPNHLPPNGNAIKITSLFPGLRPQCLRCFTARGG
jgi:hypothetical protein